MYDGYLLTIAIDLSISSVPSSSVRSSDTQERRDSLPLMSAPLHMAQVVLRVFDLLPTFSHPFLLLSNSSSSTSALEIHSSLSSSVVRSVFSRRNFSSSLRLDVSLVDPMVEVGGAERAMMRVRRYLWRTDRVGGVSMTREGGRRGRRRVLRGSSEERVEANFWK